MNKVPVITVDGPGGTGKGTVCSYLATKLNWRLLDSGALYRAVALLADRQSVALDDASGLAAIAKRLDLRFEKMCDGKGIRVMLEGIDLSQAIRTEKCGNAASLLATLPAVRQALLLRQRDYRRLPGLAADGRDMGTVIFPDATLKVFLTASVTERAKRRYKQLKEKGISVNLRGLSEDIAERDKRDEKRLVSPLKPAADAVIIDTTGCNIDAVNRQISVLVQDRLAGLVPFVH